jgi:hypothetical protein
LAFFIFSSGNIKYSIVSDVDKLLSLVFVSEDLPPVGVGAPDLHVLGLSGALDIK